MLFMPPRHGKSELVSRRFPAYAFGRNPELQIISTSYGADLASRMNRDVQRIIEAPQYGEIFPGTELFGKNIRTIANGSFLRNSEIFEIVGHRGSYRSAGVGGGITGMGCNILIVDDPIKDAEQAYSEVYRDKVWEWFTSTAYTRLESGGGILIVLTRWHEDDLAGRLLQRELVGGDKWKVVTYPAIAEKDEKHRKNGEPLHAERFPLEQLNAIKTAVGSQVWASLYQQRPSAIEGGIIKRNWIRFYRELPEKFDLMVQSWDCTFKGGATNDYVAGQVWGKAGGKLLMLPHRTYDQLDFGPTKDAIKSCRAKFPQAHAILIEDKANGPAIISELRKELSGVVAVNPEGDKFSRLQGISPLFEAGSIELPDPQVFNVPWMDDYIHNLCAFPKAAHDDDVDATSQALIYIRHKMGAGIMDFYRTQASQLKEAADKVKGVPKRDGKRVPETGLTNIAKETMANGGRISCSARQYQEVRQALLDIGSEAALAEVNRLDIEMKWSSAAAGVQVGLA
jgi:predicted phage terminase large subunit-like protein